MLLRDARAQGGGGDGAMKRSVSGSGATGHRQTSELPQALNILEIKRKLCEKRRWVWDVKEEQVQYDVQSVDSKKMVDGTWWYSVTWSDGDKTGEPRGSPGSTWKGRKR